MAQFCPHPFVAAAQAPDRGLIAPDVVLFLAMDPAAAASRGGYGGERYEKLAFQKQVHNSSRLRYELVRGCPVSLAK